MARLTRWGNSDGGLRIPKPILEAAGLRAGDEIGCRLLDSGAILLTPYKKRAEVLEGHATASTVKHLNSAW